MRHLAVIVLHPKQVVKDASVLRLDASDFQLHFPHHSSVSFGVLDKLRHHLCQTIKPFGQDLLTLAKFTYGSRQLIESFKNLVILFTVVLNHPGDTHQRLYYRF
jgi:hypothetical protein